VTERPHHQQIGPVGGVATQKRLADGLAAAVNLVDVRAIPCCEVDSHGLALETALISITDQKPQSLARGAQRDEDSGKTSTYRPIGSMRG
jgi:hypothetical protein